MATDFDRFLASRLGALMPQEPQVPTAAPAQPWMPQGTPQPQAPSPYSGGLPPQLVEMIERAAQMTQARSQPAPSPVQNQFIQGMQSQGVNPYATASTQPVAGPPAPEEPQDAPNGYVLVDFQTPGGSQGEMILVPVGLKMPANARVMGNGEPITDPAGIQRARDEGRLLEQQAPAIQSAFTTSEETMQIAQQRGVAEGTTVAEEDRPENMVGGPAVRTPEQEAQMQRSLGLDLYEKPPLPGQAGYEPTTRQGEAPVQTITTDQLLASGDEDMISIGQQLQASGITEVRSDQEILQDPATGKLSVGPKAEEESTQVDAVPESTEPGVLTPEAIRGMDTLFAEGTMTPDAVAREMERQEVYSVPVGEMLIIDANGKMDTVASAEQAPDGSTIVLYGGETSRDRPTVLGTKDQLKSGLGELGDAIDKPRIGFVSDLGAGAYETVSGNDVDRLGPDWMNDVDNAGTGGTFLEKWAKENPEAVIDAYENGYDADGDGNPDFTGGRAVWELFSADQNRVERMVNDVILDPLNYATGAGNVLRRGAQELLTNPTVARRVSAETLDVIGKVLQAPDTAVNAAVRGLGTVDRAIVDNVAPIRWLEQKLTSPTIQTAVKRATEPVEQMTDDVLRVLQRAGYDVEPRNPDVPGDAVTPPPTGPSPDGAGDVPPPRPSPAGQADTVVAPPAAPAPAPQATLPENMTIEDLIRQAEAEQPIVRGGPTVDDPFQGTTLGREVDLATPERPDWGIATPRADGSNRMVDDIFRDRAELRPQLVEFKRLHDEKARRFDAGQAAKRETSISGKLQRQQDVAEGKRKSAWDQEHSRQEVIDEGRYIVDELIPDFQTAFRGTNTPVPKYEFRQETLGNGNFANQTDEWLMERLAFLDADDTRKIDRIEDLLRKRVTAKEDPELEKYIDEAKAIRAKNQTLRSGAEQAPLPTTAAQETEAVRVARTLPVEDGDVLLQFRANTDALQAGSLEQTFGARYRVTPDGKVYVHNAHDPDGQWFLESGDEWTPDTPGDEWSPAHTGSQREIVEEMLSTGYGREVPRFDSDEAIEWGARSDSDTTYVAPQTRLRPGERVPRPARNAEAFDADIPATTAREAADTAHEAATAALKVKFPFDIPRDDLVRGIARRVQDQTGESPEIAAAYARQLLDESPEARAFFNARTAWNDAAARRRTTVGRSTPFETIEDTPPPPPTPAPEVPQQDIRNRYPRLPIDEVRETTKMTDEALEQVGLFPAQFRRKPFSEATAQSVFKKKRVNMPPIQVMRGTDGNLYVLDGHSRLEGLRRRGDTEADFQIVEGTRDELQDAAAGTNFSTDNPSPVETAAEAARLYNSGTTDFDEIARELRQGNNNWGKSGKEKARQYYNASHLPEGKLAETFDQGNLPLNQASAMGRAIADGVMTPAELDSFYINVVVPEGLSAEDITGAISRHAQRKENMTPQAQTAMFGEDDLGSTGFWQGRAEEERLYKEIRKEEKNVRNWNERERTSGIKLSPKQKVHRQQSLDRIAGLKKQIENISDPTPELVADLPDNAKLFFAQDASRDARGYFDRTPGPLKALNRQVPRRESPAANRFVGREDKALSATEFQGIQPGQHNWRVLNQQFHNGETYGERLLKHMADVKDEAAEAKRAASKGKKDQLPPTDSAVMSDTEAFEQAAERLTHDVAVEALRDRSPKAFARYEEVYKTLTTRKTKPIKDPWVARLRAFTEATANDSWWITRKYDYLLGMIREVILNNPITVARYGFVNMLGNSVSALLNDQPEIIGKAINRANVGDALRKSAPDEAVTMIVNDPSSFITKMFYRGKVKMDEPMTVGHVMDALDEMGDLPTVALHSPTENLAARLELSPLRHGVDTIIRDQTTENTVNPTKWANMVDSFRLGRMKVAPGTGGKVTGWIATRNGRDFANAMDTSFRTATWQTHMAANIAESRPAFRDLMLQDLPRGADRARFEAIWDQLPDVFGPTRIREDFAEFGTNYADRMARDWTNAIGKMDDNAREQVRKIFFSGDMTNLDTVASRVILFHFWASRATPMYMKQMASHPGFVNAYIKLMEEGKEQAESGKYGKSVEGLFFLMGTPLGFNIFYRPDALFQTILSLGAQSSDFSPEGESGIAAWMRKSGMYFNPLIDTFMNLAGYQGDTFAPDPLALYNQRGLAIAGWNLLKAHGYVDGDMPSADLQAEFLTTVRSQVSGVLPGSTNIPDSDTTLYAQQQINYLIQDVAEERGLDPAGPEAIAAMNDPESELYSEAFKRFAEAGGMSIALRILPSSVLYPRLRIARPDAVRAELADPNITEERQDELHDQRALARAGSVEARNLAAQQEEYYALGTEEQRDAFQTYTDIQNGTLAESAVINGVSITGRHLEDLSDDERRAAAELWAQQNGQTENVEAVREQRKAYRESHPEYGAFVEWRGGVYDYEGGPLAWWQDAAAGNPNAERWLESLEPLPQDEVERELTSIEAFMNYSGIRPTTYDPDAISTRDMSNVPYNPNEMSGGSGNPWEGGSKDPATQITDQLSRYQEDMAQYDLAVTSVFGEPVSMQNLPPNVRESYELILRDHGIRPPSLGTEAADYIRWRNAQRPGSDTSIGAYITWQEQWAGNTGSIPATQPTITPP